MLIRALVLALVVLATVGVSAQETSYQYRERPVVEGAVDEVMSRPEFQRLTTPEDEGEDEAREPPGWLERILDWIASWLGGGGESAAEPREEGGSALGIVVYGAAFAIVLAALALILKWVLASSREDDLANEFAASRHVRADAAPGETPPDEFWRRAHALAASGNEKLAIRELLLGAKSSLERRGLIRYRRGLTNRDYFFAATGAMRSSLATMIPIFERVHFGRRTATPEGFRACAEAYRDGFALTSSSALDGEPA